MTRASQDIVNFQLNRRDLLRWGGMGGAGLALAACAPAAPQWAALSAADDAGTDAEPTTVEIWTGFGQGRMADAMAGAVERFGEESLRACGPA